MEVARSYEIEKVPLSIPGFIVWKWAEMEMGTRVRKAEPESFGRTVEQMLGHLFRCQWLIRPLDLLGQLGLGQILGLEAR